MENSNSPTHVHNAPSTHVGDHSPQAVVNDRTGLFIAITAMVIAAFGAGVAVTNFVIVPGMIDARIGKAVAEVRADFAEEIAEAQATAAAGKEHARIGLAEMQRANAQLEAKGLITPRVH